MPTYVYGCTDPSHPRVEVAHGITQVVKLVCSECGTELHRVPQQVRFYMNPQTLLFDKLEARREEKARHGHYRRS